MAIALIIWFVIPVPAGVTANAWHLLALCWRWWWCAGPGLRRLPGAALAADGRVFVASQLAVGLLLAALHEWARHVAAHTLWLEVRSLDVQVDHWNSNESVRAAAEEILAATQALILSPDFPANRPEQAREALKAFLSGHRPVPTPTIAAPGLSLHGQMRAIDFQVHQDGRVVAGPSKATIATDWVAAGWAAKLNAAVRAASDQFVGPQASPPAPWHYTYVPAAVAGDD